MYDWYSLVNKHLLQPLYYWRAQDPKLAHLKALEERQFWSEAQLKQWQLERLQAVVAHAYDTVPLYKTLYDQAGVAPKDIQVLQDIHKLPCIAKRDIQEHGEALLSNHYLKEELVADASGGSTGQPTHFYKDKNQYQRRAADQVRHDRWSGWDLGDPFALIWGAQKDIKAISSYKQRILAQYLHRVIPLDAFELTEEKMLRYVDVLESQQPPMILGYANALTAFARFLASQRPEHKIRPKGIISSAEALSAENREIIESVFRCKVLNRYGSREVGLIASECQLQTGLHINADNVFVEVGDFSGARSTKDFEKQRVPRLCEPGESGEIIVTDFWNRGMPFIRYRMGDEGSLLAQSCGCGRTLPLMGAVSGRVSDFIIALDGRRIHGEYFTHLFYQLPNVKQFQLIQEELDHIQLKLVLKHGESDDEYLVQEIQKVCGQDVRVDILICDEIAPTASGKYLFTISKISQ